MTAPTGSYMLVIGNGTGTYATLHRTLTVASGANAVGTVKLTRPHERPASLACGRQQPARNGLLADLVPESRRR